MIEKFGFLKGSVTLECLNCHQRFRVDRFVPRVENVENLVCVACGSSTKELPYTHVPLWESVGNDLGISPDMAKALYDMWTPAEGDPSIFVDFASQTIEALKTQLSSEDQTDEQPVAQDLH